MWHMARVEDRWVNQTLKKIYAAKSPLPPADSPLPRLARPWLERGQLEQLCHVVDVVARVVHVQAAGAALPLGMLDGDGGCGR